MKNQFQLRLKLPTIGIQKLNWKYIYISNSNFFTRNRRKLKNSNFLTTLIYRLSLITISKKNLYVSQI